MFAIIRSGLVCLERPCQYFLVTSIVMVGARMGVAKVSKPAVGGKLLHPSDNCKYLTRTTEVLVKQRSPLISTLVNPV